MKILGYLLIAIVILGFISSVSPTLFPFGQKIQPFLPQCDSVGSGFVLSPATWQEQNCTCLGIKIGHDNRQSDGDLTTGCLGIIASRTCVLNEATIDGKRITKDCEVN